MLKVYVETSFISACVTDRETPKMAGWRASSIEWWDTERKYFEVFVSTEVTNELDDPDYRHREKALGMLDGLTALQPSMEVSEVASLLVARKVMPGPAVSGDAIHVAFAIVHGIGYILTWNIKHLANPNKRVHLETFCKQLGRSAPQLVTPELLKGSVGND